MKTISFGQLLVAVWLVESRSTDPSVDLEDACEES